MRRKTYPYGACDAIRLANEAKAMPCELVQCHAGILKPLSVLETTISEGSRFPPNLRLRRVYVCMYNLCMYMWILAVMLVCTFVRMYVCMHVSMYICMYVYVSMYACVYVYVHQYVCMCMSVCMHVSMRMSICMYVCVCPSVCMYACMHACRCVCMYVYVHLYVCVCLSVCMHACM
jgi:hypothetical protein